MKKSRLLGMACACVLTFVTTLTHAVVLPLESRLGGLAYYDPNLNITWLADANYAQSNSYDSDGLMSWEAATTWANTLMFGGITGWRLPTIDRNNDQIIVSCEGGGSSGCEDNEYGYLYWEEGITAASPTPFINVMAGWSYWTSTEYLAFPPDVANFYFTAGGWNAILPQNDRYAMAVINDDVFASSAVPIPSAIGLFGSGLLGLIGVARKKAA